jgi:dethiobiotin synthetase
MIQGFFITGTDTGVGKSEVAAALAALLRRQGATIRPRKPIESGCLPNHHGEPLFPQDGHTLLIASETRDRLETITPYRFEAPLSPDRAARDSGSRISLQQLVAACRVADPAPSDWLIVEGAGGFYSPIAEEALNADLAVALQLPLILVAEERLGAINQVLLARHAILSQGLTLAAVVLNRHQHDGVDNLKAIRSRISEPLLRLCAQPAQTEPPPWQALSAELEGQAELLGL